MGLFALTLGIGAIVAAAWAWISLRTGSLQGPQRFKGRQRAIGILLFLVLGTLSMLLAASIVDAEVFHYRRWSRTSHLHPGSAAFWFFVGLFWIPGVASWSRVITGLLGPFLSRNRRQTAPTSDH